MNNLLKKILKSRPSEKEITIDVEEYSGSIGFVTLQKGRILGVLPTITQTISGPELNQKRILMQTNYVFPSLAYFNSLKERKDAIVYERKLNNDLAGIGTLD